MTSNVPPLDVASLKVVQLRDELKKRDLDTKGLKPVLQKRLSEHLAAASSSSSSSSPHKRKRPPSPSSSSRSHKKQKSTPSQNGSSAQQEWDASPEPPVTRRPHPEDGQWDASPEPVWTDFVGSGSPDPEDASPYLKSSELAASSSSSSSSSSSNKRQKVSRNRWGAPANQQVKSEPVVVSETTVAAQILAAQIAAKIKTQQATTAASTPTLTAAQVAAQAQAVLKLQQHQAQGIVLRAQMAKQSAPVPLILDSEGRQVDASGKVIELDQAHIKTARANIVNESKPVQERKVKEEKNRYFDNTLAVKSKEHIEFSRKKRAHFSFIKQGKFARKAAAMRNANVRRELQKEKQEALKAALKPEPPSTGSSNAMDIDDNDNNELAAADSGEVRVKTEPGLEVKVEVMTEQFVQVKAEVKLEEYPVYHLDPAQPIPKVEWWDKQVLAAPRKRYANGLNTEMMTSFVEHPKIILPKQKDRPAPTMPLFLTQREREKVSRQAKKAKQEEITDAVRLGLIAAPEARIKLNNLARVLGSQYVEDPTAMEAMARAQTAKRAAKHLLHNAERSLTKEEKSQKQRRKLAEDTSHEVHVALFRVADLSDPQKRFKVDREAQNRHMTGCCLLFPRCNLVLVEGGPKSVRKYSHLLLNRIRWKTKRLGEDDDMDSDEEQRAQDSLVQLVWKGTVARRAFSAFLLENCRNDERKAKIYLRSQGVEHYWDMVKNHTLDEQY